MRSRSQQQQQTYAAVQDRNAGLARLSRLTRLTAIGAAVLSALFAAIAAGYSGGKSTAARLQRAASPADRPAQQSDPSASTPISADQLYPVGAGDSAAPSGSGSSLQPPPQPPAPAPVQEAPVVVSGGS